MVEYDHEVFDKFWASKWCIVNCEAADSAFSRGPLFMTSTAKDQTVFDNPWGPNSRLLLIEEDASTSSSGQSEKASFAYAQKVFESCRGVIASGTVNSSSTVCRARSEASPTVALAIMFPSTSLAAATAARCKAVTALVLVNWLPCRAHMRSMSWRFPWLPISLFQRRFSRSDSLRPRTAPVNRCTLMVKLASSGSSHLDGAIAAPLRHTSLDWLPDPCLAA
mmetsp:Transcript_109760/g.354099  ORF Transcript_109760/g.354099 Transcript_109760/m.354099 type:complete len:222 (+) Transcript_109760:2515-3180(+)